MSRVRLTHIAGFSIVELMVAVVIGLVLIGGATEVYLKSRATYAVNETTARLQETARYALSVLEPDIRMAGYWGLAKDSYSFNDFDQPTALNPAPAVGSTLCGYNFVVDLSQPIQGNNNGYAFGQAPVTGCNPFSNDPRPSSDTLTVRHASMRVTPAGAARYRLCTTRDGLTQTLSANPLTCNAPRQYNDLIVNGYYVSNQSNPGSGGATVPSLRVKTLQGGAALSMADLEVIEGVEDMQVQFGIDPGIPVPGFAAADPNRPPDEHCGIARFYVNPGGTPAAVPSPQIVSVRIWLLIRSDTTETGFIDNRTYQYADRNVANGTTNNLSSAGTATLAYSPATNTQERGFRRLLVSRTFHVRNAEAMDRLALSDPRNPCP